MHHITPIVSNLLCINITLFVVQNLLAIDLVSMFGLKCVLSTHFQPYQFFSHLFVHASLQHLLSNMFVLFTFGPVLEHTLGKKRFLLFYFTTGIGAALLYAFMQYIGMHQLITSYYAYASAPTPENFMAYLKHFSHSTYAHLHNLITNFFAYPTNLNYITQSKEVAQALYTFKVDMPTVGASGSMFGIFMAFAMLYPHTTLWLFLIPFPIKAKYVLWIYVCYEGYAAIMHNPTDNIAHVAHLGGILFAYFFIRWWQYKHA